MSDAAKAWYTHIDPQPTVHGKIQGLAAVRAEAKAEGWEGGYNEGLERGLIEAKAEQRAVDVAALRYIGFGAAADFLEQRK
jgi:hypothetical protein